MPYRIEYSPAAVVHLQGMSARNQRRVLDAVDVHLGNQPLVETRKRKPMRPNPLAPWELRVGNLRVYYDVNGGQRLVLVRVVGEKRGNRVVIGQREMTF